MVITDFMEASSYLDHEEIVEINEPFKIFNRKMDIEKPTELSP